VAGLLAPPWWKKSRCELLVIHNLVPSYALAGVFPPISRIELAIIAKLPLMLLSTMETGSPSSRIL